MSEAFLGEIRMFSGNFAPINWLMCDGSTLSTMQYQALFALLGTTYGGDGSSTFRIPDLRGRAPISKGQGPSLSSYTTGQTGGQESVGLAVANMQPHTHTLKAATTATQPSPQDAYWAPSTLNQYTASAPNASMNSGAVTLSTGAAPHENMMPFIPISFIICVDGIFPQRP